MNIFRTNIYTIKAQFIKNWQNSLRYPLAIVFWILAPILWLIPVLIFGSALTGDRYSEQLGLVAVTNDIWVFTAIGLAYLNFMFGVNWTAAFAIRDEEFKGTLESIYVTPAHKPTFVIGNGLYALSNSGFSLVIQMVFVAVLLGGIDLTNLLISGIYLFFAVFMIQGLAMILSAAVLTFKQGWRIVFTIQVIISLFTPAQFALSTLPSWMYQIAIYSPFTIAVEGFRNSLLLGFDTSMLGDWLILGIWATVFLILGIKIYFVQDRKLRKAGNLGKY